MMPGTTENGRSELFYLFEDRLYAYHELAQQVHASGEYLQDDVMVGMTEMEDSIMQFFGLPLQTNVFGDLLRSFGWQEKIDDDDVERLLQQLKGKAEKYLLSPAKGAHAIMNEGRDTHETAFDVLPFIDIDLSLYNIFLYEGLFYAQGYEAESILEEMKRSGKLPNEVVMAMNNDLLISGTYDEVAACGGLQYWQEYITNSRLNHEIPGKKMLRSIDHAVEYGWDGDFPESLVLSEFYISSITYLHLEHPAVSVEMVVDQDDDWMVIVVYMSVTELVGILKKAINTTIAGLVRTMLMEKMKQNSMIADTIYVRQSYDIYLFCNGYELQLLHTEMEDTENEKPVEHHNYYETTGFAEYISAEHGEIN